MIKSPAEYLKDEAPIDRKLVINSYREQLKGIQAQIDSLDTEQYRLIMALTKCRNQTEQKTISDQLDAAGKTLGELRNLHMKVSTEYFEYMRNS